MVDTLPENEPVTPEPKLVERPLPARSPVGTTMPRHFAAIVDNLFSMLAAAICAKQFPDDWYATHIVVGISVYLGYYFVFEILFSATPGKIMNGLVILDFNGARCSPRQVGIRTAFRILEVNPILLGALPAAARIIWSRDKQRFGDKVAGTIVVRR